MNQNRTAPNPASAETIVRVQTPGSSVHLSQAECWQLYVWLGDGAPFVRNRLRVIRHGGGGAVSLSTAEECRQVLHALANGGRRRSDALTDGLCSLRSALDDGSGQRPAPT
jgi:hypothetical protein